MVNWVYKRSIKLKGSRRFLHVPSTKLSKVGCRRSLVWDIHASERESTQASASRSTKSPSLERHGHCLYTCACMCSIGKMWNAVVLSSRISVFGSETQRPCFLPIGRLQAVYKYSIANSEALDASWRIIYTEDSGTQMDSNAGPQVKGKQILPRWPRNVKPGTTLALSRFLLSQLYAALAYLRMQSIFGVLLFLFGSDGHLTEAFDGLYHSLVFDIRHDSTSRVLSPPQAGILGPVHVPRGELGAVRPNVCHWEHEDDGSQ